MGKVYQTYDPVLQRIVAVKTLLQEGEAASEQIARFLREAQILARLSHPNIIQIFDVGCEQNILFFAMEYIEGITLQERIKQGAIPVVEAVEMMVVIAKAVAYLHQQKLLHRDLKSSNIMIKKDGTLKVMDFGLAKIGSSDAKISQEGMIVGTVGYMSPEQYEGKLEDIDERSDVYALGIILYEMLTRVLPFRGDTAVNVLTQILRTTAKPPSFHNQRVGRELDIVCLKAIEKQRQDRYQSVAELAEDLQRYRQGEPIAARPIGRVQRMWRKVKRHPRLTGSAVALLLSLMAVGLYLWYSIDIGQEIEAIMPLMMSQDAPSLKMARQRLTSLLGHPRQTPATRAQTLFWRARVHESLKDYSLAVKDYRDCLESGLEGNNADIAHRRLSICADYVANLSIILEEITGAVKEGREMGEQIQRLTCLLEHPEQTAKSKAQTLFWRGQAYQQSQKYGLAAADYGACAKLDPEGENAAIAQQRLPLCSDYAGDLAEILDEITEAVKEGREMGEQIERLTSLMKHPEHSKRDGAILFWRAQGYEQLKDYARAREDYRASSKIPSAEQNQASLREGICAFYLRDYQFSKERLEKVLSSGNPPEKNLIRESVEILMEIAVQEERWPEVTRYYSEVYARRWEPEELQPLVEWIIGMALQLRATRPEVATRYFTELQGSCRNPYFNDVCRFYGNFFQNPRASALGEIIKEFDGLCEQGPLEYRGRARLFLAYLYLRSGNLEKAESTLRDKASAQNYRQHPECVPLLDDPCFQKFK